VSILEGRVALVTGASRGIGGTIVARLLEEGASVAALARSLEARADGRRLDMRCDVTDAAAVQEAVTTTVERLGVPDIVVNNAGAFLLKPLPDTTDAELHEQLGANLVGPFLVLRAVLPLLRERGMGHVVTIGSVVDHHPYAGNAAYGASKYGVRGLHEILQAELQGSGIRTTLVSPGPTDTRLWDPLDPDGRDDLPARASMLAPLDVANAVVYAVTQPPRVNVEWLRIMPV
jgi:NAD(P)-dependent dehydrogenase (short-subunit alcohol dehydrogenase family)